MPQVADHGNAAVLEVGRHGILVLVDGVLLHRLGHDLGGHGLHVGLAERGEVLRGVALDGQVFLDHLIGYARLDRLIVHRKTRHRRIGRFGAKDRGQVLRALIHAVEDLARARLLFHENLLYRYGDRTRGEIGRPIAHASDRDRPGTRSYPRPFRAADRECRGRHSAGLVQPRPP